MLIKKVLRPLFALKLSIRDKKIRVDPWLTSGKTSHIWHLHCWHRQRRRRRRSTFKKTCFDAAKKWLLAHQRSKPSHSLSSSDYLFRFEIYLTTFDVNISLLTQRWLLFQPQLNVFKRFRQIIIFLFVEGVLLTNQPFPTVFFPVLNSRLENINIGKVNN